MSLPWLAAAARDRPDHPALRFEGISIDYATLADEVRGVARQLSARGIGASVRVGLLLENSPAWIVWAHALQFRGAVLVALNTRLTAPELAFQLRLTGVGLLICDASTEELASEASAAAGVTAAPRLARDFASEASLAVSAHVEPLPVAPEHDLALLFTSGTTGTPKAVRLPARCFEASSELSAERLGSARDDTWLACMPLFHVGGLSIVMRCALSASTLLLHRRFDELAVAQALASGEATAVSLVPTMLGRVLPHLPAAPETLRFVLLGGGPMPRQLRTLALERGIPLATTYGLSEACSQVATSEPGDPRPGAPPLADTSIEIRDDEGRVLPPGQPGQVCVRGPQLMAGYLDDAVATAETLQAGWLMTGDVGRLDEQGRLYLLDRRKDLIVTGGENVYPVEVETALCEHPDVADAAVVGERDDEWGQRVVALIVPAEDRDVDSQALDRHLRRSLAGYKIPREYRARGGLPRTASGKLHRHRLSADY